MLIDSPVGTPEERATGQVWPGRWFDFTPFGMRYELRKDVWARHTGADLNLPGNADAGAIIYAIADGVVTASKKGAGSWGWIIVIEHKDDNGKPFFSRYAHVNHIQFQVVRKNDHVTLGGAIALVGNGDGIYLEHGHHLHFDISHTQVLKNNPEHWPGDVEEEVIRRNYSEPRRFILENRTQPTIPEDSQFETMKVVATSLRIRPEPNMTFPEIGWLNFEDVVQVAGSISANGYHFALLLSINGVAFDGRGYIAREFLNAVA